MLTNDDIREMVEIGPKDYGVLEDFELENVRKEIEVAWGTTNGDTGPVTMPVRVAAVLLNAYNRSVRPEIDPFAVGKEIECGVCEGPKVAPNHNDGGPVKFEDGIAIHGEFPDADVLAAIFECSGKLPLVIGDPPYGNIVKCNWDKFKFADEAMCGWMIEWTKEIEKISLPGAALYVWGGVGLPKQNTGTNKETPPFRPFFRYLVEVERQTNYQLSTPITWKKKRAYGIQWGYLFTREEVAYLVNGDFKKPRKFTVPLLETKRGYVGYDKNYPAKSEFFRRTNVWDDVTEIMRGKTHEAQKPRKLMEVPIEVHTEPWEYVLDPFAGSGTTAHAARALGRRFVVVERDKVEFEKLVASLRGETVPSLKEEKEEKEIEDIG